MNSYQTIIAISDIITKKINKCPRCKQNILIKKNSLCAVHKQEEKDLLTSYGFREIKRKPKN